MGLVQRELESAGFSTISLSMMPELTASAGVPRIAAIEYPFGATLGFPGDAGGQLTVLRAALQALREISMPGGVVHLPFEWNVPGKVNTHPPSPPPITRYLIRHPWHLPRFLNRTPPEAPDRTIPN